MKQPGFRRRPKGDRERTHKCHLCDYSTAYKFNLTKHINGTHLNIKHKKCDECDYVTSYSSLLKSHKVSTTYMEIETAKLINCGRFMVFTRPTWLAPVTCA